MPRADALRKLAQIERLKVDSVELQLRKADVIDLKAIVSSQTSTIRNLRVEVQTGELLSKKLSDQISALNKEVGRQKRNKVFAIIGGILTTSALSYLYINK